MNLYWSAADLYWSTQQAILVDEATYIGSPADQYSFAPLLYGYGQHLSGKQRSLPAEEAQGGSIMRSPVLRSRGLRRTGDTTPI